MSAAAPPTEAERPDNPWQAAGLTALAYAAVGWLALLVAMAPSYASPLFPSSGIALAAALTWGRAGLVGTAIGAFLVNVVLGAARGQAVPLALVLPAVIAAGAALQAALGAHLLRRLAQPLLLSGPREIARAGLLGGGLACLVSPSVASVALWAAGTVPPELLPVTWGTWWVGDTLGTLIGAPVALSFIGRPTADWAPRRRTVALPLVLATLMLAAGTASIGRLEQERLQRVFEHDADQLRAEAGARFAKPLHALQGLHGAWRAAGALDEVGLRRASDWWLSQPYELQAMGVALRVPRADIAAFEARVRAQGETGFHVFEREAQAQAAGDADLVVVRRIEPRAGNTGALGVNVLSIPAARLALQRTRDSGVPALSAGFHLTQMLGDETGLVLYQAVYDGGPPPPAERQARLAGALFVTVRAERLLAGLAAGDTAYLHWCLIDPDPGPGRARLAGAPGCERDAPAALERRFALDFAARPLSLRVWAPPRGMPGGQRADAWLFSVAGLTAAALLGALLLTVTGRERRISLAVTERTAALRREIRDRAHAEQALRESEARLRSILDNVPIGVMFIDAAGRIVETNPYLCAMLERPARVLLRSTLADISHAEEQAENARQVTALLEGRVETSRRQMRLLRADGQVLWVRVHLTALRDDSGPAQRLAGVVEDITEHLRLEESEQALVRAEAASRAKSEFVSRMSHELRTPLNAMIGFAQLLGLDREPPLALHQRDWTQQIQRAGWHLLEMINDTLDLARIESGALQLALQPLELEPLVAASTALVSTHARQRGVAIDVHVDPGAQRALADETRLKQVLTNLLSNAVKYNREQGRISVTTAPAEDGTVRVAVSDTGLGMTPEQMAGLFQPYNRLGRESGPVEGTGIGLVISRRLVELMGGTLEVSSRAGQGSTFTVRLPAAPPPAHEPPAPRPERASRYRQRRVHYVEDNETNIEIMRGVLLQRPQIELEVSMHGLDGLAAIRHRRPDLILLDMQLPDISGLELLRHIKNDDDIASIPVIVVSADATTARMQEALTLGAAHYLTKPVDVPMLLEQVDELLEAQETRWG